MAQARHLRGVGRRHRHRPWPGPSWVLRRHVQLGTKGGHSPGSPRRSGLLNAPCGSTGKGPGGDVGLLCMMSPSPLDDGWLRGMSFLTARVWQTLLAECYTCTRRSLLPRPSSGAPSGWRWGALMRASWSRCSRATPRGREPRTTQRDRRRAKTAPARGFATATTTTAAPRHTRAPTSRCCRRSRRGAAGVGPIPAPAQALALPATSARGAPSVARE